MDKLLKALLIVAAFLSTAMVAFASVAEEMGAPQLPPPVLFQADKLLAFLCFCTCCVTPFRPRIAALMIWLLLAVYVVVAIGNEPLTEVPRGVFKFALLTTVFVTGAALANRSKRISPVLKVP